MDPVTPGGSAEVYRDVVEEQRELVIRWLPDGTITLVNGAYCQAVGRGREEILGTDLLGRIPEEGRRRMMEAVAGLSPTKPGWTTTSPMFRDGFELWIEWANRGVFDDSGTLVEVQSVGRDVTRRRENEDALREREAWFRVLIDHAPEAITLTDGETGTLVSFNDRTLALFGRTREELAGAIPFALSPPLQPDGRSSEEAGWDYLRRALEGDPPVFEWVHTRGDGTEVLCEIRLARLPLPGRSLVRASLTDLTERKLAEKQLRLTQAAVDQVADGAVVVLPNGRVVYANKAAGDLVGYSREELLSMRVQDLDPNISPRGWRGFWAQLKENGSQTILTRQRRKDGGTVGVEVVVSRIAFDSHEYGVCTFRDLSEQKKAAEALEFRRTLMEAQAEASLDGILVVDPKGDVVFNNQRFLEILEFDENLLEVDEDTRLRALMEKVEDPQEFLSKIQFLRGHLSESSLDEIRLRNGRVIERHSAPIQGPRGTHFGRLWVFRDVTDQRLSDEALREGRVRLQMLTEAGFEGLAVTENGRLVDLNRQLAEMLGWEREELVGRPVTDLVAEESRELVAEKNRAGSPQPYEHLARRRDGSVFPVEVQGRAMPHRGRSVRVTAVRDLSEKKRAEEALQDREAKLESIFRAAPVGIGLTKDRTIQEVNEKFCEMVGYDRDELLGKPSVMLYSTQEEFERVGEEKYRQIEAFGSGTVETRFLHKDGRAIDVILSSTPLNSEDLGAGVTFTALDISDRKRFEEALLKSEATSRALVEQAPYGILRTDREGRLLSANPALLEMLEYPSREEMVGIDLPSAVSASAGEAKVLGAAVRQGSPLEGVELQWRTWAGREITVWLRGGPVVEGEGAVEGYQMILEDVTERRKLQAQLRQAQKMEAVGQLTGGIAHDFNNLLSVILLHSELLRGALSDTDPVLRTAVDGVSEAAERAAEMTSQLLGFSRQANLSFGPTDLAGVVRGVSSILKRLIPENIETRILAEKGGPLVQADSGAVEQILLNLATNARDSMARGGTLEIQVGEHFVNDEYCAERPWASQGAHVCIRVRDSGEGMDEKTRSRIFEPFFTTKATGEGTGLGMAMVFGLVKQHNGFIDVETELGEGTCITLCFPVLEASPASEATKAVEAEMPGGMETILLVEDEEMVRHVGKGVLKQHGYRVMAAADGREALVVYGDHAEEIDLVVSDVVMPNLGGLELLQALNRDPEAPKVLLTSGYPGRVSGGGAGTQTEIPFIEKPWKAGDFLRRVREVLDEV